MSGKQRKGKALSLWYNEKMRLHTHEWPHIEKCTRAEHAFDYLSKVGLIEQCNVLNGRKATDAELLTVHTKRHVDEIRKLTDAARRDPTNRGLREPDGPGGVYYSPEADAAARLACGCVIDAALDVLGATKKASQAPSARPLSFALVRPPGHHAGADDTPGHRAEGFCFFNSAAVAAGVVLERGLAQKVCILDWDVHHGNGTQQLFYGDSRMLYLSLHRYGDRWYPETGAADEVGEGKGKGATVNVPWPENGMSDNDYYAAFELVLLPILKAFSPDLLIVSAGFDAAEGDAQGKMRVTPAGFGHMTSMLLDAVSCPIAAVLEGGYNALVTSQCCEAVLRVLLGEPSAPLSPLLLSKCCEPTLRHVIQIQQRYWPVLRQRKGALDRFFADAAAKGQPERVSKRASAGRAPVRTYEEEPVTKKSKSAHGARAGEVDPMSPKAIAVAAVKRSDEALESSHAELELAKQRLETATQSLEAAKASVERERKLLVQAQAVHDAASADAAATRQRVKEAEDAEAAAERDDSNGTANPQGTVLWSHKTKCEPGRRVFAHYGDDPEELWFRATITAVYRNDIGQYCDVQYDDGDTETRKPIKRVRALESDDSDSDEDSDDDDDE